MDLVVHAGTLLRFLGVQLTVVPQVDYRNIPLLGDGIQRLHHVLILGRSILGVSIERNGAIPGLLGVVDDVLDRAADGLGIIGFTASRYLAQRLLLGSIVSGKLAYKQVAGDLGVQRLQTSHIALGVVVHQSSTTYCFLHTGSAGAGGDHVNERLAIGRKALGDGRAQENDVLARERAVFHLFQVFRVVLAAQVATVQQTEQTNNNNDQNDSQHDQQHGKTILHYAAGAVLFTHLLCYTQCRGYCRKNWVE